MQAMQILQNIISLSILSATVYGLFRLKYALKRAAAAPSFAEPA